MIRIFSCLALSLTLAACGGSAPPRQKPDARAPVALASDTVTSANFGDARPIDSWGGKPPQSYAVHGIDVARYQTAVDWPTARANGVNFAFIKATEGGDRVDPMFEDHWRGAGRAGIRRGAYHFYYHCRPAAEQARWFIQHVPKVKGGLPPVLDMEWTPFSPTCTIRRAPEVIREDARIFIDMLTRHYGQKPILYTSIDFFEDNQMWKVQGADFWLRAVAKHPQDLYAGQHWLFWQYTSTGLIPGIAGQVDINVYEGSPAQWQAWLAARAP
ncbi:glycoside hydrolase family 25 protein [Pseudogemmobacter faecipullorum]|uniref:Glycoside hydrolase family 25 protein n=1 Tax=Pseudogemmobacter faecipullorum TaxID=2755041 RepID=A0ABS8CP51_9RHOB|nr:glycoside hydrolase family 25 protein [Pseudogemmobacter faecipullorum]MCB5411168.1 glycoside hydrolase family 25 protein [Pseudogemmobacter faecipullorum]